MASLLRLFKRAIGFVDSDDDLCSSSGSESSILVAQSVPADVWGGLLQFCSTKDSMALSSTCNWLRDVVLGSIRSVLVKSMPTAFPGARCTSLQHVQATSGVIDLDSMLSALHDCPQLRSFQAACGDAEKTAAIILHLPLLARLESVHLLQPVVDSRLGVALASCEALRDVKLLMGGGSERSKGRKEDVASFLTELTALTSLRSLVGLYLRDEADVTQLHAAVAAWGELEELVVAAAPDRDGGRKLAVNVVGLAATVAACCPRIRQLGLRSASADEQALTEEDWSAVIGMRQLRELQLSGKLTAPCLARLCELTELEKLKLYRCSLDDKAWLELAAATATLTGLRSLQLMPRDLPVEAVCNLLRVVAAHDGLLHVSMEDPLEPLDLPSGAERELLAAAVAEAVCASPVREWHVFIPLCLMTFLRSWGGRKPAAAVVSLGLGLTDSCACKRSEDMHLLLRCVRSCPSLRKVFLNATSVGDDCWRALIAAVTAEPLAPTRLTMHSTYDTVLKYKDKEAKLSASGLQLY